MLGDALDITDGPSAIRWPKTAAPSVLDSEVGRGLDARLVRSGDDVCILSVGKMLAAAREAADRLEAAGTNVTVWDVRVVPLDEAMLADAARHRLVVTVEDGLRHGGVGSMIADRLADTAEQPLVRVMGVPTEYIPHGKPDVILAALGLDAAGIEAEVLVHR
jgi:1-deoxy-D-xylulose-5-phosphate synthase